MKTKPFDWVIERAQPPLFNILTILLIATSIWIFNMDRALVTPEAPHGIVSFELAGDLATSDAILRSWLQPARLTANLLQGLDFLYLLVYPAWLSLAASRLRVRLSGTWRRVASATAWVALAAAPLDAAENYALIQQMLHGATAFHARLAWACAVAKFAVVGFAAALICAATLRLAARLALRQFRRLAYPQPSRSEAAEGSGLFSGEYAESVVHFCTHSLFPYLTGVAMLLMRLAGRMMF